MLSNSPKRGFFHFLKDALFASLLAILPQHSMKPPNKQMQKTNPSLSKLFYFLTLFESHPQDHEQNTEPLSKRRRSQGV
ncbi:hypothetical protein FHS56_002165 [Thermonema lapsum]|uniref:Uncharacterized protein n=1 Tax=Thermonema lapsum TaxID=28195 RepID=A0A846MSR2_9BACT|nr:hypothetical protein [Thermonema lapsum]